MNIGADKKGRKMDFPSQSLKKHLAVFGGSGSGKTVFSKVIIEEAVKENIPCILIDSQGDLASFALNNDLDTVIFTPASSKGIPISINPFKKPSKDLEEEELVNIVHQISNSVADLLGYKDDDKGNAARSILYYVLMDSFEGNNEIKNFDDLIAILKNIPESIKEKTDDLISSKKELDVMIRKLSFLSVGENDLLFNFGVPLDMRHFMKKGQISVIYLNTLTDEEEKQFFLSMLATELYQWMLCNPSDKLQLIFYIDEIAGFIPAGSQKPISKPILQLIYKQARKYGVGCVASTQNPGDIDYKAFAQFSSWAIGRLTTKQDIAKIINALKSIAGDKITSISGKLPQLKPGEFVLFSPDNFKEIVELRVRQLVSPHKTLNDDDIKNATSAETRKVFDSFLSQKKSTSAGKQSSASKSSASSSYSSESPSSLTSSSAKYSSVSSSAAQSSASRPSAGIPHIPMITSAQQAGEMIDKQKKKMFGIIGPHNENIDSLQLVFEPLYKAKIRSLEKTFLGLRKLVEEHVVLFSAVSGNPISKDYTEYESFNNIFNLSANDIAVLKALGSRELTPHDISAKSSLNIQSVTSSITDLSKKKLITRGKKVGKSQLWNSFVKLNIPNLDKLSFDIKIDSEDVSAKIEKPKINIKTLEKAVNSWFGASEIVEHELIYLPVYEAVLSSKKGKRNLRLNASNGKFLKE